MYPPRSVTVCGGAQLVIFGASPHEPIQHIEHTTPRNTNVTKCCQRRLWRHAATSGAPGPQPAPLSPWRPAPSAAFDKPHNRTPCFPAATQIAPPCALHPEVKLQDLPFGRGRQRSEFWEGTLNGWGFDDNDTHPLPCPLPRSHAPDSAPTPTFSAHLHAGSRRSSWASGRRVTAGVTRGVTAGVTAGVTRSKTERAVSLTGDTPCH